MLKTITVAASIIISGYLLKTGLEKFKTSERTVEVRGLAENTVQSNEANWVIAYSTAGNDLATTNNSYLKNQKILVDFLKKLGFLESEISKTPAAITDNWAQSYGNQKPPNKFTIRGSVGVTSNKVPMVSAALQKTDELISLGVAFENSTASYYFTDLNKIKSKMIQQANTNARSSAQKFAEDTKSKLGEIKSASQGLFTISDAGGEYNTNQSINKKIRVVNQIIYFLD